MQKDLVGRTRRPELTPLGPVVRAGVGKHVALGIEGGTRYLPIDGRKSLETLFVVLVPKVDHPVPTDGGKGPVRVERDGVDAVHVLLLAVTFEGEGILAGDLLEVVDTDTSLDAADGEARHVGKGRDATRLEFERTFLPRMLPRRAGYVVGDNVPSGRGHHHEIAAHVEGVAPFGQFQSHGGVGAAPVPEFELLVPPPADDHVAGGEISDVADGSVVGANLLRHAVGGLLAELPHTDGLVGAAGEDGVAVVREGRAQSRGLVLVIDCVCVCVAIAVGEMAK